MDPRNDLIIDYKTFQLGFKKVPAAEPSQLVWTTDVIAYPLLLGLGVVFLTIISPVYLVLSWHQSRMVQLLKDEPLLSEYGDKRIAICQERIDSLKAEARTTMASLSLENPKKLPFKIPQQEKDWSDFKWNNFFKGKFSKLAKTIPKESSDRDLLKNLRTTQPALQRYLKQKTILENSEEEKRIECIRRIAQVSFIKSEFNKQRCLEILKLSLCWIIPLGSYLAEKFNIFPREPEISEANKTKLSTIGLENDSFVKAHNALIKKKYLVPYFP